MLTRFSPTTIVVAVLLLCANVAFAQTAKFSSNRTQGCLPVTVDFKDESTGTITAWLWDFGNGKTSDLQNPSAIYTEAGNYNVTLTVFNGSASNSLTRAGYIVVFDYPAVDFGWDVDSGCAPLKVNFTDKTSAASGVITNWSWVFGDGGTSTAANPTYTFQTPGDRTVSLRARNEHGCEKLFSSPSTIKALGPLTKFKPDKKAVCTLPATFKFNNETTGKDLTYQWDFADGKTSTEKNPEHTYDKAGTYNVVLKARDGDGCEQSFSMKVNAGNEGDLDFNVSSVKVCIGDKIDFELVELITSDLAVSQTWNFGDGSPMPTDREVSYIYPGPGTYTVTLTAKLLNHSCNSVVSKTILVAAPLVPAFEVKTDCKYSLILTNTTVGATRVEWYVDGKLESSAPSYTSSHSAPGTQKVKLVAYNIADCGYELETEEFIEPIPIADFDPAKENSCGGLSLAGCAPFNIPFTNKSTSLDPAVRYHWDFGDGNSATTTDASNIYFSKGLYQVTLTATDSRNCSDSKTRFVVVSNTTPVASFTMNKTIACAGEKVTFTSTSTGADFWCWDFGDNSSGEGSETSHIFNEPGTYQITLTAKNGGCSSISASKSITIKDPLVRFGLGRTCLDPFTIGLKNLSANYDTIYWDFGDGQVSGEVDAVKSHHYDKEGDYILKLIATNFSTGCTTIDSTLLSIYKVKADFDVNKNPCKGAPLPLTDKSKAAVEWAWKVDDFESEEQNPVTRLDIPGEYDVTLNVKDAQGCEASETKTITVVNIEGAFSYNVASDCETLTVKFFDDSNGAPDPTSWSWDFGDGSTSTERNPVHVYTELGEYDVSLTVTNADGSCTYPKENVVDFTIPEPDFGAGKKEFCPNDVVVIANISKNAVAYEWDYGDGRRSDFVSPSIIYNSNGIYDVSLFARDAYGCERKRTKLNFVIIEPPTADFSVASANGECPPFTATFTDKSQKDIVEWQWEFGDGNTSLHQDPAHVYLEPGKFDVKLTVTDDNGCTGSKTVNQFVTVDGPTGSFTGPGGSLCTNKTIAFTADVQNTAVLRWDLGDGTVVETTDHDVSHTYRSIGTYTPALLLIDENGCQTVADGSAVLLVKDTTAVSMLVSPLCIKTGEPFTMKGKNENDNEALSWSWVIDGVVVGNGNDFETTIDEPGLHFITGQASNKFACISHAHDTVRIQGPIEMIPNVITPNSDGSNDSFRIIGLENSVWDLHIVNRWGNAVFSKRDYRGDWDGNEQPAGVYYYILKNAMCEDRDYKGFISIVR